MKQYRDEINKLLKERPDLAYFQEYIDKELKKAGNTHNRLAVMENLIYENRTKMIEALNDVKEKLLSIKVKK